MARTVVTIHVDAAAPIQVLNMVKEATSGASLSAFLRTHALPVVQGDIETWIELGGAGKWPPLKDSTIKIREYYSYTPDDPNWRSGAMLDWLTDPNSHSTVFGPSDAVMLVPNSYSGGPLNFRKLETAQRGRSEPNQFGTGGETVTPPREVLVMHEFTARKIVTALEYWIMGWVAGGLRGGAP